MLLKFTIKSIQNAFPFLMSFPIYRKLSSSLHRNQKNSFRLTDTVSFSLSELTKNSSLLIVTIRILAPLKEPEIKRKLLFRLVDDTFI